MIWDIMHSELVLDLPTCEISTENTVRPPPRSVRTENTGTCLSLVSTAVSIYSIRSLMIPPGGTYISAISADSRQWHKIRSLPVRVFPYVRCLFQIIFSSWHNGAANSLRLYTPHSPPIAHATQGPYVRRIGNILLAG